MWPDSDCHGNCDDHCCYIGGVVCPFLEEDTVGGRRWACGLYRELRDWDDVYADPRYTSLAVATWFTTNYPGYGCGDWPQDIPVLNIEVGVSFCCYSYPE